MFSENEIRVIREAVSRVLNLSFEEEKLRIGEGPGLTVEETENEVRILAESRSALARGFFRLAQERAAGRRPVRVREEKHFESCGSFLDFSRNGVMKVESCKKYMDYSAALGLDAIVLYTEDTFTVPEYPYMGYLRGRLTPEEYRELDAYAESLGMELIPCIQTLAHMGNFLQWPPHEPMKDQPTILMCDEEKTYEFIEAQVRAVRSYVRGKRLHIGMDEAHTVGLGNYYRRFGPTDRFELLSRHLDRCVKICEKYGFRPMIWSDMFFRLGSRTGDYYDPESRIPQDVIDRLPEVDLCYWDYEHMDEGMYEHMLEEHARMSPNTAFAGGIWNWSGFLPHVKRTRDTMEPGVRCCARHRTRTVLATTWGDDGNETSPFLSLNQMPIFSEFCWRGPECTHEEIAETGAFLTGLPDEAYEAFGLFYPDHADRRAGKALIWCDPLYPLGLREEELEPAIRRSEEALRILGRYQEREDCRYAAALFEVCRRKAALKRDLRPLYLAGRREEVRAIAEEDIPKLLEAYESLRKLHRAQWQSTYKRNGWEVLALRYGSVEGRLRDVQEALLDWCGGKLDRLCELDETPLDPTRKNGMQFYPVFVSPAFNL